MSKVLITGGAGFIGRHLASLLLSTGYEVRVLDSFIEQVHGSDPRPVDPGVELTRGDVRDADAVRRAMRDIDCVVHLAAEVGVGQSMYEIGRYVSVNDVGTAIVLEAMLKRDVRRIVVASSMSVYGEGLYRTRNGEIVEDAERAVASLTGWDPVDARGEPLTPIATPEWKRPSLSSVYAISKYSQERLVMTVAAAYGIEAAALRLWNVFGPGQALSNPYTGVLAIFGSRLLNNQPPMIFEDGAQRRDFVHVGDVCRAFALALERPAATGGVFNIGSGTSWTVREVAARLASVLGREELRPQLLGKARKGDIRHCFADISLARQVLGYAPEHGLDDGLPALAAWLRDQRPTDFVPAARRELEARGLVA